MGLIAPEERARRWATDNKIALSPRQLRTLVYELGTAEADAFALAAELAGAWSKEASAAIYEAANQAIQEAVATAH